MGKPSPPRAHHHRHHHRRRRRCMRVGQSGSTRLPVRTVAVGAKPYWCVRVLKANGLTQTAHAYSFFFTPSRLPLNSAGTPDSKVVRSLGTLGIDLLSFQDLSDQSIYQTVRNTSNHNCYLTFINATAVCWVDASTKPRWSGRGCGPSCSNHGRWCLVAFQRLPMPSNTAASVLKLRCALVSQGARVAAALCAGYY